MGIHLMPPLFELVIRPKPTVTFNAIAAANLSYQRYGADYPDVHNGAGMESNAVAHIRQIKNINNIYDVFRYPGGWDTSSIGSGSLIQSAHMRCRLQGKDTSDGHDNLIIVSGAGLVFGIADYLTLLSAVTSFGSINTADLPAVGEYFNIPLNSLGLAAINKTGTTLLGLRMGRDISATPPAGTDLRIWVYLYGFPTLEIAY